MGSGSICLCLPLALTLPGAPISRYDRMTAPGRSRRCCPVEEERSKRQLLLVADTLLILSIVSRKRPFAIHDVNWI